jgi:23S rRNA (uracil1939-C5)-methyltransferase
MANDITLTPTSLVYGGDALARLPDGRACFIPFCLPGEQVRVRLVEEKRGHARAELVEVLQPSPLRISPRCPHFGVCGGCHYQHIDYAQQMEFKSQAFTEQLQHIGGLVNPPLQPMRPSPLAWNYRNTIQFHLSETGRVGFEKAGAH